MVCRPRALNEIAPDFSSQRTVRWAVVARSRGSTRGASAAQHSADHVRIAPLTDWLWLDCALIVPDLKTAGAASDWLPRVSTALDTPTNHEVGNSSLSGCFTAARQQLPRSGLSSAGKLLRPRVRVLLAS